MLILTPFVNPTTPGWLLILCGLVLLAMAELGRSGKLVRMPSPSALALFAIGLAGICVFEASGHFVDESLIASSPQTFDAFAYAMHVGTLTVVSLLIAARLTKQRGTSDEYAELGAMLLATAGVLLCCFVDDVIEAVLALELATVPVIAAMISRQDGTAHATAVGRGVSLSHALSTLLLISGLGVMAGLAGATSLEAIEFTFGASYFTERPTGDPTIMGHVAALLIVAGICGKLAAAPFHVGADNVLGRTSTAFEAFFHLVPKAAGVVVLIRLIPALSAFQESMQLCLTVAAVATMTIGNINAVTRSKVREALGYLAMANVGYLLAGCAVGCFECRYPEFGFTAGSGMPGGLQSTVLHLLTMSVGFVGAMTALQYLDRSERPIEQLEDLNGIIRRQPVACVCLVLALLSLASIPPLPGFWSQLSLTASHFSLEMKSSIGQVVILLVLINLLMSAAACCKVISIMCFEPMLGRPRPSGGIAAIAVSVVCAMLLVGGGLLAGQFIRGVEQLELTRTPPQSQSTPQN